MKKEYKLPETLYYLLEKNKMSQNKLADELCQTQNSVWKWLKGKSNPDIYSLMNLANVFNVSLDYLVYGFEEGGNDESERISSTGEKD